MKESSKYLHRFIGMKKLSLNIGECKKKSNINKIDLAQAFQFLLNEFRIRDIFLCATTLRIHFFFIRKSPRYTQQRYLSNNVSISFIVWAKKKKNDPFSGKCWLCAYHIFVDGYLFDLSPP